MGRPGITYEQVSVLLNKNPGMTNAELRIALGSGSLSTIHAHANRWREERRKLDLITTLLPPDIQRAIIQWHNDDIRANRESLLAELAIERKEMSLIVAEANEQSISLAQKEKEILELRIELTRQKDIASSQAMRLSQLEGTVAALQNETAVERARLVLTLEQLQGLKVEIDRLRPFEFEVVRLKERLAIRDEL